MFFYFSRRLLDSVATVIGISLLVFALMHWLPGDPVGAMLFDSAGSADTAAKLRDQLGLNDPPLIQYGRFITGALRGDLGNSLFTRRPVIGEIITFMPNTLELAAAALALATLAGITTGILAALYRNSWIDQFVMLLSLVGVSMPIFWSGLLLILVLAVWLNWLPATSGGQGLNGLILPALSLAFGPAALIARLTRGSFLDILPQDYIRTAYAKGLANHSVMIRHALQNALIPIMTVVGLQMGSMLSGTVVAETVFTRPGIGTLIINGIKQRDYLVVQGAVLYVSVLYVLVNLAVDACYGLVDPRIRYAEK